jgi:hypothetical protein
MRARERLFSCCTSGHISAHPLSRICNPAASEYKDLQSEKRIKNADIKNGRIANPTKQAKRMKRILLIEYHHYLWSNKFRCEWICIKKCSWRKSLTDSCIRTFINN